MALKASTTLPGIEAVAQRIENARQGFIDLCVENYGFTPEQAAHILAVYKRLRCVKLDTSVGKGYRSQTLVKQVQSLFGMQPITPRRKNIKQRERPCSIKWDCENERLSRDHRPVDEHLANPTHAPSLSDQCLGQSCLRPDCVLPSAQETSAAA